jgi:hypothetical protein
MKITMYELIGLFKDGKAPKKIKHSGTIYLFDNDINWYADEDGYYCLDSDHRYINDIIEIIEDKENEEKKIPEKLDLQYKDIIYNPKFKEEIIMYCDNLQFKINEIIDYLKSKGEE